MSHKLGIDGIVNLDSVDNVLDTDLLKPQDWGIHYLKNIGNISTRILRKIGRVYSIIPHTCIIECTYPEFIIVDYSDKITCDMMSFNDFTAEKKYIVLIITVIHWSHTIKI